MKTFLGDTCDPTFGYQTRKAMKSKKLECPQDFHSRKWKVWEPVASQGSRVGSYLPETDSSSAHLPGETAETVTGLRFDCDCLVIQNILLAL